jgi:hypothetical protein
MTRTPSAFEGGRNAQPSTQRRRFNALKRLLSFLFFRKDWLPVHGRPRITATFGQGSWRLR